MEKLKKMLEKGEDVINLFLVLFIIFYLLKIYLYNELIFESLLLPFVCLGVIKFFKNKELVEYARKSLVISEVVLFILILINAFESMGYVVGISDFLYTYSILIANLIVYAYVVVSIPFDKKQKVKKETKVYKNLTFIVLGAYLLYFLFFLMDRNFGSALFGFIILALELCLNLLLMRYAYKN